MQASNRATESQLFDVNHRTLNRLGGTDRYDKVTCFLYLLLYLSIPTSEWFLRAKKSVESRAPNFPVEVGLQKPTVLGFFDG